MNLKKLLISGILLVPVAVYAQEIASISSDTINASGTPDILGEFSPQTKLTAMTIGMGSLTGWAVGYTLKKFAKLAALVVGVAFISIQFLAFHNFITIDWDKIKSAVPDEKLQQTWLDIMAIMTFNIPFAGSFLVGFWLGFRKG